MGDSHKEKNKLDDTRVHEIETNNDESTNLETNEVNLNLYSSESAADSSRNNEKLEAAKRENIEFQAKIQYLLTHLDEIVKYDNTNSNSTKKGGDTDKPNMFSRVCSHTFSNPAKVSLDSKRDNRESTDSDYYIEEEDSSDSDSSHCTTISVSLSLSITESGRCISDITTSDFTLSDSEDEGNDQNEENSTPGQLKASLVVPDNKDNSNIVENKTTDPALDKKIANLDSDKQNDSLSFSTNIATKRKLSQNPTNNYSDTDKDSMHIAKKLKTINDNNDVESKIDNKKATLEMFNQKDTQNQGKRKNDFCLPENNKKRKNLASTFSKLRTKEEKDSGLDDLNITINFNKLRLECISEENDEVIITNEQNFNPKIFEDQLQNLADDCEENNNTANSNNSTGLNAGKMITTLNRNDQNYTKESIENLSLIFSNVKLDYQNPNNNTNSKFVKKDLILFLKEQKNVDSEFQDQNTDSNNKIITESKKEDNSSLDLKNNSSPMIISEETPCDISNENKSLVVENLNNSIEQSENKEDDLFVNQSFNSDDVETIVVDVDEIEPNGTSDDKYTEMIYSSDERSDQEVSGANRRVLRSRAEEVFYENYAYNIATNEDINMDDEDALVPNLDENVENNSLLFLENSDDILLFYA